MAALRGSTFDKQIKNAFFRLLALGEGRHLKEDNFTHSLALAEKRSMYLKDFKEFLEQKGIQEGKINKYLTEENIKSFLEARTSDLSAKSSLDYVTGFNSLMKSLEQANITIPSNPSKNDFLKDMREQFRQELKELDFEKGRYIQDLDTKLEQLRENRFESYTIAKLQAETGLRISEAIEVTKNFNKYYNEQTGKLENVVGKGNHQYNPKPISSSLAKEIQKIEKIPSKSTYARDLKTIGIAKSHDFRVTYAKDKVIQKLEQGKEYKQALKEVSQEINHHRPDMTQYYLDRS